MTKFSDLSILSYGAGQDSTALLLLYVSDSEFRKTYAPRGLVVVMADTGDEHPYTTEHVAWTKVFCEKNGIPFFHLTSDLGYHIKSWPDLITPQLRDSEDQYAATLVQRGGKTCTMNLKISPIYKWLDEYLNERFGYGYTIQEGRGCRKQALLRFGFEQGKIRMLIGYAKGEERRMQKSKALQDLQWQRGGYWQHISREYPLIDLGWDREKCQAYIKDQLGSEVMPSNCMRCPYMSDEELLWLYLNHRDKFQEWVVIENKKLERGRAHEKNYGIFRTEETLAQRVERIQGKYAGLGTESLSRLLEEKKRTRGCGAGAY